MSGIFGARVGRTAISVVEKVTGVTLGGRVCKTVVVN